MVKNLPAMQETNVWSLGSGWEDLEKEMATHSSILAWRIPRTEEPGGLQSMVSQSQTWLSDLVACKVQSCMHAKAAPAPVVSRPRQWPVPRLKCVQMGSCCLYAEGWNSTSRNTITSEWCWPSCGRVWASRETDKRGWMPRYGLSWLLRTHP